MTALLILLLAATAIAQDPIVQMWTISHTFVSPDGAKKLVPVVNGQYPGPELRGKVGQKVIITVVNKLPTDTTSIHWHGIKQTGTPYSDGVPGVTQCPIGPGESFVYEFVLTEPGTLWWHSHSAFQKSSLYGAIVIEGDKGEIAYDEERTLLLNDWFHASGDEQLEGLTRPRADFKWIGDAQSLLFNGMGVFECLNSTKYEEFFGKPCPKVDLKKTKPFTMTVEPGKTYRLRLVGASSLSFLNFNIQGHNLIVVETETTLVKPFETESIDIGAGQSYSVLLKTKTLAELQASKEHNGNFHMQLNVRHRSSGPTGLAILNYANYTVATPLGEPREWPGRDDLDWSLRHARNFSALTPVSLPNATETVKILGTQNELPDGRIGWAMNNYSYEEPPTPLLHSMALDYRAEIDRWVDERNMPVYDYTKAPKETEFGEFARIGTHVQVFAKDEVVDFVFQNAANLGGHDEVHPWHLHLHNFWVLAFGEEHEAWTEDDNSKYDLTGAVSRNTFTLYPGSWTAIRVKFDNAGMAHFHCHILAHLGMGMGFVAQIGGKGDIPTIPRGMELCGSVLRELPPPSLNPIVGSGCAKYDTLLNGQIVSGA